MTETVAATLDSLTAYAPAWGLVLIFVFMTIESSFIPFPSEVVMIPAGFLACRGGLTTGIPVLDMLLAIVCGLAGSMAGAYVNYYLAIWLGRPFLHRYGKYFFLKEEALNRSEEIFREYGDPSAYQYSGGLVKDGFQAFQLFYRTGCRYLDDCACSAGLVLCNAGGQYELS